MHLRAMRPRKQPHGRGLTCTPHLAPGLGSPPPVTTPLAARAHLCRAGCAHHVPRPGLCAPGMRAAASALRAVLLACAAGGALASCIDLEPNITLEQCKDLTVTTANFTSSKLCSQDLSNWNMAAFNEAEKELFNGMTTEQYIRSLIQSHWSPWRQQAMTETQAFFASLPSRNWPAFPSCVQRSGAINGGQECLSGEFVSVAHRPPFQTTPCVPPRAEFTRCSSRTGLRGVAAGRRAAHSPDQQAAQRHQRPCPGDGLAHGPSAAAC
jgi:hypothetical protein